MVETVSEERIMNQDVNDRRHGIERKGNSTKAPLAPVIKAPWRFAAPNPHSGSKVIVTNIGKLA